jgi:hypothetical protein
MIISSAGAHVDQQIRTRSVGRNNHRCNTIMLGRLWGNQSRGSRRDGESRPPAENEDRGEVDRSPAPETSNPDGGVTGVSVPAPGVLEYSRQNSSLSTPTIVARKRTSDKLDTVCFHPIQPLVCLSDRGGKVLVWDYEADEVIYMNQFGGVDEGGMQEMVLRERAEHYSSLINSTGLMGDDKDAVARQDWKRGEKKRLKKDMRFQGMGISSGKVVDVRFLDWQTCMWQQGRQDGLDGVSAESGIRAAFSTDSLGMGGDQSGGTARVVGGSARRHCWVVIASENKVTMHDLASSRGVDILRASCFESAKPTKLAFLVRNAGALVGKGNAETQSSDQVVRDLQSQHYVAPIIAVGTSSGAIYLVLVSTGQVVAKCADAHSKAVTCLEVIGPARQGGPDRLVSGSLDGSIAVWDPSRSVKTVGGKGGACIQPITCFKAHEGEVHDLQLFGIQVANGFSEVEGKSPSTHAHSTTTALSLRPFLASVGADKQLCTWNTTSWNREYMPVQALQDSALVSLGTTLKPGIGMGSSAPLVGVSDKSCAIFALDPTANMAKSRVIVDVEPWLDKGNKKRPKIYSIAVNPSKPYMIGLATNTGLAIVKDPICATIPFSTSLLSQQVFASSFMDMEMHKEEEEVGNEADEGVKNADAKETAGEPEQIKIPQGITSINFVQNNLVATLYEMKIDKKRESIERQMHLKNVGSLILAGNSEQGNLFSNVGGDAKIDVSPSGKYISIVWPSSNRYAVWGFGDLDDYGRRWRFIDGGHGTQVAWSTIAPIYAVMCHNEAYIENMKPDEGLHHSEIVPGFSMTYDQKEPVSKGQDNVVKNDVSAHQGDEPPSYDDIIASDELKSGGPAEGCSVRVHAIDESDEPKYIGYSDVVLKEGARAVKIHGGSLLGVSFVDSSPGASQKTSLRFFSWVDLSPIGSDMPSPNWISWDQESTMCALGYHTAIQLCAVYPHFHCFASLGINNSESAFWQIRQLYVSTPTSISVVYADSRESFVEEICLADFSVQSKEPSTEAQDNVFGHRALRPSGPVRLIGIKHSYLVVHDSLERPFLISLRNHDLRARSLAAKGEIDMAVALTAKYVRPVLHDGTAQCILAMGSKADYEKVLTLPGLSPEMKISISIRHGDWNRAARAFQAHALGVNDAVYSSLINEEVTLFSSNRGASIHSSGQKDAIGERNMAAVSNILEEAERNATSLQEDEKFDSATGLDGASIDYSSDIDDQSESSNSSKSDDFVDPIDWTSWRQDASQAVQSDQNQTSVATKSVGSLSVPIIDHTEMLRILESTDLGLELASSALESHRESAKQILGTLLAYSSSLTKDRLEKLVDQMAMSNMTESMRNLWSASCGSTGTSSQKSISVAALLAASVGGLQDTDMVESLQQAGLYPLAYLYAAVWGSGSPNTPESVDVIWKEQIANS